MFRPDVQVSGILWEKYGIFSNHNMLWLFGAEQQFEPRIHQFLHKLREWVRVFYVFVQKFPQKTLGFHEFPCNTCSHDEVGIIRGIKTSQMTKSGFIQAPNTSN